MLRKFKFMVPFCRCRYVYFFMVLNISLEIQYGVFFIKQTRKYVLRFYIIQKKIFSFIFESQITAFMKMKKKMFYDLKILKKLQFFFESIAKISTSRTVGWLKSKKVQIEKVFKPKWNRNQNTFIFFSILDWFNHATHTRTLFIWINFSIFSSLCYRPTLHTIIMLRV